MSTTQQAPALETLMARTTPGPAGCVVWTGPVTGHRGAPAVYVGRKRYLVRRTAYELAVGPVSDDQKVVHKPLPGVTAELLPLCINPHHAQALSKKAGESHCPKGHPYDDGNVRWRASGTRRCVECARVLETKRRVGPPRSPRTAPGPQFDEQFNALFSQYKQRITQMILHDVRGKDHHLAEDLTAETFIKSWFLLPRLEVRSDSQTFAWLATIARRTVMAHYRVKRNTQERPADTGHWSFANREMTTGPGGTYTSAVTGFRTATLAHAGDSDPDPDEALRRARQKPAVKR